MPTFHEVIKSAILAALLATPAFADAPKWDVFADTWVGTDGLGRRLPTYEDVGPPKADKTVVMFYYLWEDDHAADTGPVHDMAKELYRDPNFAAPVGPWWYWGEPLLGYYLLADPFVSRVHASQLTDAGVDAIMFDSTNGYTHKPQYTAICKAYTDWRALGNATPLIGHVTHANSAKTAQLLYDEFYSKSLYPDLWFRWQGKPVLMTETDKVSPPIKSFFTTRDSWAWHNPTGWFGNGHDKWPWIDTYPQQYGWDLNPNTPEEISVSAAQHPSSTIGRSFTYAQNTEPAPTDRQPGKGLYFAEQWQQAFKVSPPVVFVTNYNEWIAKSYADDKPHGKPRVFLGHPLRPGEGFLVDEYDPEFSRDIEPAAPTPANRGVDDNYYYQLVAAVRRYKGVRPLPAVKAVPVTIDGNFDDWKNAAPEFRDTIGDPVQRDFAGASQTLHYKNDSGRNDIVTAHVSYDARNVYFHVQTHAPITPCTGDDWMVLYLDTDQNAATGWLGYDYAINKSGVTAVATTLSRNVGGRDEWKPVASDLHYAVNGRDLELAVPRSVIGDPKTIDFKWADHCHAKGDWTDFTLNGDAAPNARFNYRAKLATGR